MATLPDLDTSQIGFIAYWNALDHGVSEIDPTEVLTATIVKTYEQYDNGVQGVAEYMAGGMKLEAYFRVKSDGWFVVWTPRYSVPEPDQKDVEGSKWYESATDPDGYYNLLIRWHCGDNRDIAPNISTDCCERIIYNLASELSNFGAITYDSGDVGRFSYTFSQATSLYFDKNGGAWGNSKTINGGISYTTGTEIYYARAVGYGYSADNLYNNVDDLMFEGAMLVTGFASEGVIKAGSVDISDILTTPGTYYYNHGGGDVRTNVWICHIIFWG